MDALRLIKPLLEQVRSRLYRIFMVNLLSVVMCVLACVYLQVGGEHDALTTAAAAEAATATASDAIAS